MTDHKILPQVSILVPVYGVEKWIEKCAVSLLEQDYPSLQFVFVDDCTPDESMNVLQSVIERFPWQKDNIQIIRHHRNRGLSAARNTALHAAAGDFVMPVDSDDYLSCHTAVSQIMADLLREGADAAIFDMQHIFPDKTVEKHQTLPSDHNEYIRRLISRQTAVCLWGGIYQRSLFTGHGIHSIEGLNMGEDYAVKPRLLYAAKKIIHVSRPFYCYSHLSENTYTKKFSDKYVSDLKQALSVLTDFFRHVPDAADFESSLHHAHLQVQAELFLWWGVYHGSRSSFTEISRMEPPGGQVSACRLSLKYRVILFLARHHLLTPLRLYSSTGLKIKNLLKS